MEVDAETVQKELMSEVSKIINFNIYKNKYANLHRWKYANVGKQSGQKSLFDEKNKLAACGDWLIKGNVEAAFLSAMDLVGKIKNSIKK
jgi:predicted NAD/FAD-dependent oxidoreductase